MTNVSTDPSDAFDLEQTIAEFQEALSLSPMCFRDAVLKKTMLASIPVRAHYLLASMDAMGHPDPAQLKGLFDHLRQRTPVREAAALDSALRIALKMSHQCVVTQAMEYVAGIAYSMGLTAEAPSIVGTDLNEPESSEGPTLH